LIARHIGTMTADFYAAQAWVAQHGHPTTPEDFKRADVIAFEPIDAFLTHLQNSGLRVTADQCRVASQNAVVLAEYVRRGLGAGILLRAHADQLPDVVRLLPDWPGIPVPFWLVSHRELRTSARVRLVFDVLAEGLSHHIASPKPSLD
jgi:DNA-binding transcriptional LysR family regulator